MSQPTYCHCTHCGRESHPVYARKYDGLCLDCYNAGVGDLLERADSLLDRIVALEDELVEARHNRTCHRCNPKPALGCDEIVKARFDNAELRAKLAEAVKLLRPFANGHLYFDEEHANKPERERDEMPLNYYDWRINTPKVGDCRKSAAFVAENGKVKS